MHVLFVAEQAAHALSPQAVQTPFAKKYALWHAVHVIVLFVFVHAEQCGRAQ
jgi:hypothetical protein